MFFSHYSSLRERIERFGAVPTQDYYLGNPLTYRFKPNRPPKLNQVTPYLYISHESALHAHPDRFAILGRLFGFQDALV